MKRQILLLAAALAAACPAAYATEVFDAPGGGISCLGDVDIGIHPDYGVFCTVVCTNQSGRGFDISRERQRLF